MLRMMASQMKNKFDKYWSEYSVLLAMVVVLDPRVKFSLLKRCYFKIHPQTAQERSNMVKNNLFMLYEEYARSDIVMSARYQGKQSKDSSSSNSTRSVSNVCR